MMSITQKLSRLTDLFRPVASDAEIREELEFHLAMRERDNIAAGMNPESAMQDARARFGDFERNFAECLQVSYGLRTIVSRFQMAFTVAFAALAIYLGFALWQTKSLYEAELQTLRNQMEQPGKAASETGQTTPSANAENLANHDQRNRLIVATFTADPLSEPWSDWSVLADVQSKDI